MKYCVKVYRPVEGERLENATITAATIEINAQYVLTGGIQLEGNGWAQFFGNYTFDYIKAEDNRLYALPQMALFTRGVMEAVGVRKWEELEGQNLRVLGRSRQGIRAVGHIYKDYWFFMETLDKVFAKAKEPERITEVA